MRTSPERAYALLVEANPVPETELTTDPQPVRSPRLTIVGPRDAPTATPVLTPSSRGPGTLARRLIPTLAAMLALFVAAGLLLARDDQTSDRLPTPAEDALARAEAFFPALNEGRIDDLESILGEVTEADRLMWEMNAILSLGGYPVEPGACAVAEEVGSIVIVHCPVTFTDPVFVASGAPSGIYPFRAFEGVVSWQPVEGTDIGPAVASYAAYLEAVYPAEYGERCDPASRIGTEYNRNGDLALVPECGELMLEHIGEIAEWVEAGRPPLDE